MKKNASYLLFLALATGLLYFSFRGVKWADFTDGLRQARYGWILISMAFSVFAFWIRGARWRLLIQGAGYKVSKRQAFDAINMAYLTNFAVPRAGELARCGVLVKASGAPFDMLLGTVVLERAFDLLCLFACVVLVVGLQWSVFGFFMKEQIWRPLLAMIAGKTLYLIAIIALIIIILFVVYKFKNKLQRLLTGLKSGFTMEQKWPFFGYTLALWICYLSMSFCTIRAFPAVASLNLLDAAFLMVTGSLGWVVPVQGGIGAYHFIVSLALTSVYGITQTQGLIFATISHESQAVTMILFGLISLIHLARSTK